MNTTKGKIATKQNKTKGLVEKIFSSWKISDITNSLNGFNRLKKRHTVSLTWVEWHLIGGACLISVRDKTTPCLSQLGFCSVPMPGSCPGHMDWNRNWKKKKPTYCVIIFIWHSGKSKSIKKKNGSMLVRGQRSQKMKREYRLSWGIKELSEWKQCSLSWFHILIVMGLHDWTC